MYMAVRKKESSFPILLKKKKRLPKKNDKPILFTLRLGYLMYIKNKAYQHYMDNMDDGSLNDMDFETQMVFSSHYFNNYVTQEDIDNQEIKIFQDNMHKILSELSITMYHLANEIGIHQRELLTHFLDTQVHLEKTEKFKINNIKFLLLRRIEATTRLYDKNASIAKKEKQAPK